MQSIADTTLTTRNSSPALLEITSSEKYNGLLVRKKSKFIRNLIFNLLIHIDSIHDPWFFIHYVFEYFLAMQFISPSFFLNSKNYWTNGSREKSVLELLGFFVYFISETNRLQYSFYILCTIMVVFIFILLFYLINAINYHKTSKIPDLAPRIIEISNCIVFRYLIAFSLRLSGESISYYFNYSNIDTITLYSSVICIVFCVLLLWFYFIVLSSSLVFRPVSFNTILKTPNCAIIIMVSSVNFFGGLGSLFSGYIETVMSFLVLFSYIFSLFIPFLLGTIINEALKSLYFSLSIFGTINTMIFLFNKYYQNNASERLLLLLILSGVLSFFLSNLLFRKRFLKYLLILDSWLDNGNIEECYDYKIALRCGINGLSIAHPICIDWSVFKMVINKWPEVPEGWIIFAKFVAIYPEESSLLSYISQQIDKKCPKKSFSKQISMQMLSILQQREFNLTPVLKQKIEYSKKIVNIAKRNLRNVWDQVIQGNLEEMDSSISISYDSIARSTAEINHILSEYPNNRFVARLYSQYVSEVLADVEAKNMWRENMNLIKRGISIMEDQTHKLGLKYFPKLPRKTILAKRSYSDPSESLIGTDFEADDSLQDSKSSNLASIIKERIDNISYPSLLYSNIMLTIIVFLFVLPSFLLILYTQPFIDYISKPLGIIYHLSLLRSLNFQIPALIHHMVLENSPLGNPLFLKIDLKGYVPKALGSSNETRDQVLFLAKTVYSSLQQLSDYRSIGNDDPAYSEIQSVVFGSNILYTQYLASNRPMPQRTSYHLIMTDYAFQATKAAEVEPLTEAILNNSILLNPALNCAPIAASMSTTLILLVQTLSRSILSIINIVTYFGYIYPVIMFLLIYLVFWYSHYRIQMDQKNIYLCLLSIPKNVVSSLSDNLRLLKREKSEISKKNDSDKEISKQEEHLLKVMASASDFGSGSIGHKLLLLISGILLTTCISFSSIVLSRLIQS